MFDPVCVSRGAISFTPRPPPHVSQKGVGRRPTGPAGRLGRGPLGAPKFGPPCGPTVSPQAALASEIRSGFETALRSENKTALRSSYSRPLQNKDLGAQIEDRIAVPNQDRGFDGWGGAVATTLLRIPWPRGHQKAARSRPHGGLKSKPPFPFRWLERPRGQRLAVGSLPAAVQSWMALPAPRAPVAPAALPGFSAPASAAAAPLLATAPYFTRSVAAAMSASSSSGSASTSAPAAVAHLLITPRWTPRGRAL